MTYDINQTVQTLFELRKSCSGTVPPSGCVAPFIEATLGALFPQLSKVPALSPETLRPLVQEGTRLLAELTEPVLRPESTGTLVDNFITALPTLHTIIKEDAQAIYAGDPAAQSIDEVIIAYPGFLAIAVYRIANWLLKQGVHTVPRMLSEHAHRLAGVDIHPGATIGSSFVIDHGTGIVIGETTVIHDNVKIYQGVTLGALSVDKSLANKKRHPTIEQGVVIYANATILGGETVVGQGSIIGGNVWLTTSVPARSRVYHRSDHSVTS